MGERPRRFESSRPHGRCSLAEVIQASLESMSRDNRTVMNEEQDQPTVEVETVRPFTELLEALEEAGFEPVRRPPFEERSADVVEILGIYLVEKAADSVVERLIGAVSAWATTWLRRFLDERGEPSDSISIEIYGPQREVLRRRGRRELANLTRHPAPIALRRDPVRNRAARDRSLRGRHRRRWRSCRDALPTMRPARSSRRARVSPGPAARRAG